MQYAVIGKKSCDTQLQLPHAFEFFTPVPLAKCDPLFRLHCSVKSLASQLQRRSCNLHDVNTRLSTKRGKRERCCETSTKAFAKLKADEAPEVSPHKNVTVKNFDQGNILNTFQYFFVRDRSAGPQLSTWR